MVFQQEVAIALKFLLPVVELNVSTVIQDRTFMSKELALEKLMELTAVLVQQQ